jgi:hypothetical protein
MRDNLILYNVEEKEEENTTQLIHTILESHLEIQDAKSIKIDRSHSKEKHVPLWQSLIISHHTYYFDHTYYLIIIRVIKIIFPFTAFLTMNLQR